MEFLKVRGFCAGPSAARWSTLAPQTQALLIDGAEYCLSKKKGKISLAREILDLSGLPISAQEQTVLDREKAMKLNDIIARMDDYDESYIEEIKQQIMGYPTLIKTRDLDFPLVLLDPATQQSPEFVRKEMPQDDIEYIIYKRVFNAQEKGHMTGVVKVLALGPDYVDLEKLEILTETEYRRHKESILRDVADDLEQLHQAGIIFYGSQTRECRLQ